MCVFENDKLLIEKLETKVGKAGIVINTYVIQNKITNECMVIDPSCDAKVINECIEKLGATLAFIVITHSHADHILSLADLLETRDKDETVVYVHEEDGAKLFDTLYNCEEIVGVTVKQVDMNRVTYVRSKDVLILGNIDFRVINTPGHTKGSIILYNKEFDIMFSGDTIFENTYGRTDLISGSHLDMGKSLEYIFNTYENPLVFSGHGNEFYLDNSKRKIRLLYLYKG